MGCLMFPLALLCLALVSGVGSITVAIPERVYEHARGDNITLPCTFKTKITSPSLVIVTWTALKVKSETEDTVIATFYSHNGRTDYTSKYEGRAKVDVKVATGKADLRLYSITMDENRSYECRAQIPGDDEGTPADIAQMVVLVAPSTPICKVDGKTEYGQDIKLTCHSAEGSPPPTYKWDSRDVRNMPKAKEPRSTDDVKGVKTSVQIVQTASHEQRVAHLEEKTNGMEAHSHQMNLRLYGLPEVEGENVKQQILEICSWVVPEARDAVLTLFVDVCHRVGMRQENRTRPVIIRFTSREFKDQLWKSAKGSEYLMSRKLNFGQDPAAKDKETRKKLWHYKGAARKKEGGVLSLFNITKETSGYYTCTSSNKIRSATCNLTLTVRPSSMLGSVGQTAGIIAGVVAALLIGIIVIYCCCCKKKGKDEEYAMGVREEEYRDKEPTENGERREPRDDDRVERDPRDDRRDEYGDGRSDHNDRRSDYDDRRSDYDDRRSDYTERRSDYDDRRSDYTERRDRYDDDRDRRYDDDRDRRYDDDRDRRYDDDRDRRYDADDRPPLPKSKPPRQDYDD